MDSVIATHVVAAVLATSQELLTLWRKMIAAGTQTTLSGTLVAVGWVSKSGQQRIRATARAQQIDLALMAHALELHPDYGVLLVEHRKRVRIHLLQRRCDLAAGRLIQRSDESSPIVVTYRAEERERSPGVAAAIR